MNHPLALWAVATALAAATAGSFAEHQPPQASGLNPRSSHATPGQRLDLGSIDEKTEKKDLEAQDKDETELIAESVEVLMNSIQKPLSGMGGERSPEQSQTPLQLRSMSGK